MKLTINKLYNIPILENNFLLAFSLLIIGLGLYYKVIFYDFILYDDTIYLTALSSNVSNFQDTLTWAFTNIVNSNWDPITLLSLAIDYRFYGLNAGGYHLTNLILHCFNAILVFLVLTHIFEKKKLSYIVSLIFLIHPINVEAVAWISERKGLLAAFFSLLSLYYFLKFTTHHYKKLFYSLALFAFLMALLSKAVYVTLPLIILLIIWYRKKSINNNFDIIKNLIILSPFLFLSFVFGIITIYTHTKTGAIVPAELNPIGLRLLNAINSYIIYIKQTFYPFDLIIHYRYKPIPFNTTLINIVLISGLGFIAYLHRDKRPYLFFSLAWYTIFLIPVIGIIQSGYHAHADRYAYLPLIGLYIAVLLLLSELIQSLKLNPVIVKGFGFMVLSILAFTTWTQHTTWRNSRYLFEHAYSVDNDDYIANTNLARVHIQNLRVSKGILYFRKAQKIAPTYINMYDAVSYDLIQIGKLDLAVTILNDLIKYDKYFIKTYITIAQIRINQDKYSEAIKVLLEAKKLSTKNPKIDYLLGYSYHKMNQDDEANKILKNSSKSDIYSNKINALLNEINNPE